MYDEFPRPLDGSPAQRVTNQFFSPSNTDEFGVYVCSNYIFTLFDKELADIFENVLNSKPGSQINSSKYSKGNQDEMITNLVPRVSLRSP